MIPYNASLRATADGLGRNSQTTLVKMPAGSTLEAVASLLHIQTTGQSTPGNEPSFPAIAQDKTLLSVPETPRTPTKSRQEFQMAFDENMQNKPVKHNQTFVLLLSWADGLDDLKVKPELAKLEGFLQKSYGFEVKQEQLGREKPGQQLDPTRLTHQLNRILSGFLDDYDGQDRLLIIYYGGHGRYENGTQKQKQGMELHSAASSQTRRFSVAWGDAHSVIKTRADVLVIFDCCQAGGFGGTRVRGAEPNFEFIAACGPNQPAAPPGEESFTTAFMWALKEFKRNKECPFTSANLVDKIKGRLAIFNPNHSDNPQSTQTPELQRINLTSSGIVWIAPQNLRKLDNNHRTPQAEHRRAHHEYIDLRFNFFRRVEIKDAANVAKHLSRLVNDQDDFAKHISLIEVSNPVEKFVNHWRNETAKRKRTSSFNSDSVAEQMHGDVASAATDITIRKSGFDSDQLGAMESSKRRKRPRRNENIEIPEAPSPSLQESQGALFHLQMFLDCSFRWMATRVRPRNDQFMLLSLLC